MNDDDDAPAPERRVFLTGLELRKAKDGSKSPGILSGYAAVFDQLSLDLGYFREKLEPGCFTDALKTCDVRALYNHDPNFLLGRMSSGTLTCKEDSAGLMFENELPDTSNGRDRAEEVGRKDLTGCSFSFTTDVDQWDMSGTVPIRTVIRVKTLYDLGPVTFPAYEQTSVGMRALNHEDSRAAVRSLELALTEIKEQKEPLEVLAKRYRMPIEKLQSMPRNSTSRHVHRSLSLARARLRLAEAQISNP